MFQSENVSCHMKLCPLRSLRAQTEHFHRGNERIFSVTTRAGFMSLLRWILSGPNIVEKSSLFCWVLVLLGDLQSDSSQATVLHTGWRGCLWSVVLLKDSCQMHGKCLDPTVWSCYCIQTESNYHQALYENVHQEESQLFNGISHSCCPGVRHCLALTRGLWRPRSCVTSSGEPLRGGVFQIQSQSCFVVCDFVGRGNSQKYVTSEENSSNCDLEYKWRKRISLNSCRPQDSCNLWGLKKWPKEKNGPTNLELIHSQCMQVRQEVVIMMYLFQECH